MLIVHICVFLITILQLYFLTCEINTRDTTPEIIMCSGLKCGSRASNPRSLLGIVLHSIDLKFVFRRNALISVCSVFSDDR